MMPQMISEQPEAFKRPTCLSSQVFKEPLYFYAPLAIFLLCNEHRNDVYLPILWENSQLMLNRLPFYVSVVFCV